MSDWQPNLYLEFEKERTQPSIDLVNRIERESPQRIIDIGCGPGNSTKVLSSRWPQAQIIGLDNSEMMINHAKSDYPELNWVCADASGDLSALGAFDIVFSNAAIQWMPDQELLLPKLFGMLNAGGVLAVQVPCTINMPIHTELMKLITSHKWEKYYSDFAGGYSKYQADFYYNLLCTLTNEIDMWETRYFHIMNTHADIVKWYSGSGLRLYLSCLRDEAQNAEFLSEYENRLKSAYPVQTDGRILFPFTRIFFTAKKKGNV